MLDEVAGASYEDYESVDVVKRVMEITDGVGCKVRYIYIARVTILKHIYTNSSLHSSCPRQAVIDGIGLSTVDISIDSLARRGIFVSFGNASGAVPAFPVLRLIAKSAFVTRPKLLDYTVDRAELLSRSDEIFGWLKDGTLKVAVDTSFPLDDAPEGHKYLESGASKGKVLYDCK